tara:strand:+ start:1058 stop:1423 length:366 start_codon:yes stop_codon:yes gene_type:complete
MSGVSVVYSRPGGSSGTIALAIPGDTLIDAIDEDGSSMKMKVRDYLIERTKIEEIIGAGESPERGDTIVETFADYSRTFDVFEMEGGIGLNGETSRLWDKAGQVLRIHAVEVSKVTTTAGS